MRGALLTAACVATAIALLFARPHPTPGPPMRDFEAYYAAGSVAAAGGDAYSQAIWEAERTLPGVNGARYEALPFVGPPAALPLFALLARLPFTAANLLWRALLIASLAALAVTVLALSGRKIAASSLLAIAAAALGFGPLTSALALGQIALPAYLFAALALVWPGLSLLAWVQPNVGITLLGELFARRRAAWFAAGLGAFALACIAVAGFPGIEYYVMLLHQHALAERFSAIQITPAAIAYGFGAAAPQASAVGAAVALAAACCWIVLVRSASDSRARFCITCALLPLAMPFFHEHDLLVAFVPAVLLSIDAPERVWPLAVTGALFTGTDWLGLAQRPDGTLQTLLLIAALGAALIALRERVQVRMLLYPAGVLAVIAVAAVFAHAHPAPIWPDAMRALRGNPASLPIAEAWNAQQRASGLFAQNALWAALRLLSLFGCATIAAAAALSSKYPARSKNPSPVPA